MGRGEEAVEGDCHQEELLHHRVRLYAQGRPVGRGRGAANQVRQPEVPRRERVEEGRLKLALSMALGRSAFQAVISARLEISPITSRESVFITCGRAADRF